MSISSGNLDAFWTVSKTLSFTKAAEKLHVTQSALSQRILNLESELETTLFIRDRGGLRLTEVAHELARYCQSKNLLEEEFLATLKSRGSKELAGVLRLGGFSSVMRSVVLPSLKGLCIDHPKLRLSLITRETFELPDLLKIGEIDYMILDQKLERDELECKLLGKEKNVLVQKNKYRGPDIYLDHDEKDPATFAYLKLARKTLKSVERRYLDDVYGLIDGVRAGIGRAVLPLHLIKNEKDLEIVSPTTVLEIPVYLYFFKQPYYSKLHIEVLKSLGHCDSILAKA
jgi:DNA-binding transcriptional LysR family regulator